MSEFNYRKLKDVIEEKKYPFTIGQIRDFMLRDYGGIRKAIRKIGKNLYMREDLFEEWMGRVWSQK